MSLPCFLKREGPHAWERDATRFFEQPRILAPGIARDTEASSLGFLDSFIRVFCSFVFLFEEKQQGRQKSRQLAGEGRGREREGCFLSLRPQTSGGLSGGAWVKAWGRASANG